MMDEQNETKEAKRETVGHCKPPEHTKFKKGQSGNPRGRPKGSLNVATVLQKTLHERIVISENGRRGTVTRLEASIRQLVDKAASGDLKALQLLAALVRSAEERSVQTESISVRMGQTMAPSIV